MLAAEVKKKMDSYGYNVIDWKAGGDLKIWLGDDNAFGVNSKGHNSQDSQCQTTQICTLEYKRGKVTEKV